MASLIYTSHSNKSIFLRQKSGLATSLIMSKKERKEESKKEGRKEERKKFLNLLPRSLVLLTLFLLATMFFASFHCTASSFSYFQTPLKCYHLKEALSDYLIRSGFPTTSFSILPLFGFLHCANSIYHYFVCFFICVFVCFPNEMQTVQVRCLSCSSFWP